MSEKEKSHDEATPNGESEKKKSGKFLIIIIVVLVVVLIIGGVVTLLMLSNHDAESSSGTKKEASSLENTSGESKKHVSEANTEVGIMYPLDPFTVNLLSESGRRYLKVTINLEMEGKELSPELEKKKPLLRDIIIRTLSSKSLEEISTNQGKEKLKQEIINGMNPRLKDAKIKNVYFTDFVVQ